MFPDWSAVQPCVSVLCFCLVCRCVELLHPLWHRAHFSNRWVHSMMVSSWVIGNGIHSISLSATSFVSKFCSCTDGPFVGLFDRMIYFDWQVDGCFVLQLDGDVCIRYQWPNETWHLVMGIFYAFVLFFIPLTVIAVCYGCVLYMLSKRINTNIGGESNSQHQNGRNQNNTFELARKNTIVTLFIVACFFIICWSQNQVIFLMYNLGYDLDWNSSYYHFTVLMTNLNCTVNPFIYLFKYKTFQTALKSFCKCTKQNPQTTGNVYSLPSQSSSESHVP